MTTTSSTNAANETSFHICDKGMLHLILILILRTPSSLRRFVPLSLCPFVPLSLSRSVK